VAEVKEQLDSAAVAVFQQRVWRAQRVAWALMALIVLAAVAGLLGPGPLSSRTVTSADGAFRVDYARFLRRGTRTTLRIHVRPATAEASTLALWLARSYLETMKVDGVVPPPGRVQAGPDRMTWSFEVNPQPGKPLTVTFHLLPEGSGGLRAEVGLGTGPTLGFRQWAYP
jgi:hypothetical protein